MDRNRGELMTKLLMLSEELKRISLLGRSASEFGSDDDLILLSGGPESHLAKFSILAGPTKTRVIIRQPSEAELPAQHSYDPLTEDIILQSPPKQIVGEIEEWKHGSWYHSTKIFRKDLAELMQQLGEFSGQGVIGKLSRGPKRSFWISSMAYDLVQFTQPIRLQHKPKEGEILAVFWLIENWIIETSDELTAYGINDDWVEKVNSVIADLPEQSTLKIPEPLEVISEISSSHDDKSHENQIEKILESIRDGRLYQLNFGREWNGKMSGEPFDVFKRLTRDNPAPFSCFIHSPDLSLSLISSSPESLLSSENGILKTSPIKGTRPRGDSEEMELALRKELLSDEKERAEHRMLVDLMRNDLGTSCKTGSVQVQRFDVETFSNVQHLVSHIYGELEDTTTTEAFTNIFPGGSITGCPRTVVCAGVDKIEARNRSFWTGSVGWFEPHAAGGVGEGAWNILIRTIEAKKSGNTWNASITAGGGITIASNPKNEVEESKWKSTALKKACGWTLSEEIETHLASGKLEIYPVKVKQQRLEIEPEIGSISKYPDYERLAKPILFIDNLDSFSYNLVHYFASQNFDVLVIDGKGNDSETVAENFEEILEKVQPSALVIGPGPGWPNESKLSMKAADLALSGLEFPTLGVCLGHQALALADGWDVKRSKNGPVHGRPVTVDHDRTGIFAGKESPMRLTRYNSLIVDGKGESLVECAWSDSENMALTHPELDVYGLQVHPESVGSEYGFSLLKSFLDKAQC